MAEAHAPLLPPAEERAAESTCARGAGRGWHRTVGALLLGVAGLGVMLEASGCRVRPSALVGAQPPGGWGNAQCYAVTGGTCSFTQCDPARKARCTWAQCTCAPGSCVGADGVCHHSEARLVASNFRLRNVKFRDQYLFAPKNFFEEQLRTTVNVGMFPDLWNLYQLPGLAFTNNQSLFYFLRPVAYPEYVVGVGQSVMSDAGLPGSIYSALLLHLTSRRGPLNWLPYNPSLAMSSFCTPAGHADSVVISPLAGTASLYIHHLSWEVFGWVWSDPGEGGYWTPEPPLSVRFPACRSR